MVTSDLDEETRGCLTAPRQKCSKRTKEMRSVNGLDIRFVNIERNGTLQKRNRKDNAGTITFPDKDPLNSGHRTTTDSYLSANFQIRMRVYADSPAQTLAQILYFAVRNWRGFTLEANESNYSWKTQQIQPIVRIDLDKQITGK